MWQRVQTIFLCIGAVALLVSLVQPIWTLQGSDGAHTLTPFYYLSGDSHQYMPFSLTAILSIASITLIITEIRKYKNRMAQMKLGALNSLFLVGVIGSSVYFATQLVKEFQGGAYGLGMYLPVVAVICNLIANYFIRKDEKLVRDSERLR